MSGPSGELDLSWSLHTSLWSGAHAPGPAGALEDVSEAVTSLLRNKSREAEAQRVGWGIPGPTLGMHNPQTYTYTYTHSRTPTLPDQLKNSRVRTHTGTLRGAPGGNDLQQRHLVGAWAVLPSEAARLSPREMVSRPRTVKVRGVSYAEGHKRSVDMNSSTSGSLTAPLSSQHHSADPVPTSMTYTDPNARSHQVLPLGPCCGHLYPSTRSPTETHLQQTWARL